jgi:hypothetical protein
MEKEEREFHHVTLRVLKVYKAETFRDEKQTITAIVSIKMDKEIAGELKEMIEDYLYNYVEGKDRLSFTLEGKFT